MIKYIRVITKHDVEAFVNELSDYVHILESIDLSVEIQYSSISGSYTALVIGRIK